MVPYETGGGKDGSDGGSGGSDLHDHNSDISGSDPAGESSPGSGAPEFAELLT